MNPRISEKTIGVTPKLKAAGCLLALSLVLPPSPALAGDMSCENNSGLSYAACKALMGAIFVVGGSVAVVQSAKNALTPNTPVKVLLPSGELINGELKPMVVSGRIVKSGDTVKLTCSEKPNFAADMERTGKKSYYTCDLEYPDLGEGKPKQSPFYIGIDATGIPQESTMKLERPLVWVDGKGV